MAFSKEAKLFGPELMRVRRSAGLSREELASLVEKSKGYIALLEQGQRRPRPALVVHLCDELRLTQSERARLLTRCAVDSVGDIAPEVPFAGLRLLERLLDVFTLARQTEAGERALEALEAADDALDAPTEGELQSKFAVHFAYAVARVMERWGNSEWLSTREYFEQITGAMLAPDLVMVRAINVIDPRRWLDDPRERIYLDANGGAVKNGKDVRRLFIVGSDVSSDDLLQVAAEQQRMGLSRVRWLAAAVVSALADVPEDTVLFEFDGSASMLVGHGDPDDILRVEFGERVSNAAEIDRYRQYFDRMFASAEAEPLAAL